jgi:hypothetical protein
MSDPKSGAEPEKQADLSSDFKLKTTQELAAIKARLIWFLMPTFLTLLAVFGISLWTFFKVTDIQMQVSETDRTLAEMRRAAKAKQLADERARLIYLPNGLNDAERADFYHMAEGSEVYPLTWIKALETENGKLFLDDVERMGFLPDPDNKDGLPVGLTSGITVGLEPLGPMVGLNCAACHVGELHYQGKRIRIDGAPNLLNTREFFKSLIDSALGTAKDPAKLIAFLARVKEIEEKTAGVEPSKARLFARSLLIKVAKREDEAFKTILHPVIEKFINDEGKLEPFDFKTALKDGAQDKKSLHDKITKELDPVDITNLLGKSTFLKSVANDAEHKGAITQTLHDIYVSIRLLRARAIFLKKLGPVGLNPRTNWGPGRVDAFGSARTFLFDDKYEPINPVSYPPIFELATHNWFHYDNNTNTFLERNFGQALGVGAVYDPKTLNSTLQVHNLRKLEAMARKLSAPKWPEDVFGKIDQDRAGRGANLYAKYCADCHDAPKTGEAFVKLFELDDIKTDPERAKMFAEKLPKDSPFPDVLFSEAIKSVLFKLKTKEIANFPAAEKKEIEDQPVDWRGPGKYSARTLKGSWSTAPYLHNGSVPTMDDLLKPAKDRPTKFYVGSHQYDIEKLGYVNDDKTILYDTTTQGNSNSGHEGDKYGTNMSAEERKDLLEYLKTH